MGALVGGAGGAEDHDSMDVNRDASDGAGFEKLGFVGVEEGGAGAKDEGGGGMTIPGRGPGGVVVSDGVGA